MPAELLNKENPLTGWALRRPITTLVVALAVAACSFFGLRQMPKDILPNLGIPIIYVAQPFGGLDAAQMESYITYYYEYHFLYIAGIEHVESKNIQSVALIKLQFHPGTDMAQALAETINYVNRAKAFMPEGVVPPFVMRFDAGSEPVGKLVFSSDKRTLAELQNYALNFVRPLFATLPGVSAPPPFGASQRTVLVQIDPVKLQRYRLSPDDVAAAVGQANKIVPSGNIPMGNFYPIVPLNSMVKDIHELDDVPLRLGTYPTVFLKDVATVTDGADLKTGYALVDGKRTVYIPVTKRADASTLTVVDEVKNSIPRFQSVLPEDIKVSYEFDQSGYVRRAIGSLVMEGLLGAILTGLMVFLFLRDLKSALIVVVNIPLAMMGAVLALWLTKQTINIMTLGGLALAIGILVDETTVAIENIHTHLSKGEKPFQAVLDSAGEIAVPLLLSLFCVLAVFIPSFFMTGVAKALFVPLTLAVGFSMVASFILSMTLVPILSVRFLRKGHGVQSRGTGGFAGFRKDYTSFLTNLFPSRKFLLAGYVAVSAAIVLLFFGFAIGREIFPQVDVGQFQIRLRAPAGTLIDQTEARVLKVLQIIRDEVGEGNIESSVGFVGAQPPSYPINTIYLWTSGPQEAVLEIALGPKARVNIEELKEKLRKDLTAQLPDTQVSFEPSGLVDRIMSLGSSTPIEVAVNGRNLSDVRSYAGKIHDALQGLPFLRDLQYGQVFDYPAIQVTADRKKVGLKGFTMAGIGKALVPATSSSRYVLPDYWSDPKNGITYQVQVEIPQGTFKSLQDIQNIPVPLNGAAVALGNLADITPSTSIGEFDRYNMQRVASLTANLHGEDLGRATQRIRKILKSLEASKPRGVEVAMRGQVAALDNMMGELGLGLGLAVVVIFLLLAANYESTSLSLIVLSTVPAVLAGVAILLWATGTSLNIESFMGTIMATGVAVANAILLVTFAERSRSSHGNSWKGALEGAQTRLRPILMTSLAMIAGMLPMALGLGEGGQQTAPLGLSVIGGLAGATIATLVFLPLIFAVAREKSPLRSSFFNLDDPENGVSEGLRKTR